MDSYKIKKNKINIENIINQWSECINYLNYLHLKKKKVDVLKNNFEHQILQYMNKKNTNLLSISNINIKKTIPSPQKESITKSFLQKTLLQYFNGNQQYTQKLLDFIWNSRELKPSQPKLNKLKNKKLKNKKLN